MAITLNPKRKAEIEDSIEDVAKALREAADGLGEDAEAAIAQAAEAVRKAADALAARAKPQAKELAAKAVQEVKEHPIASAAAALTAAAALISLLATARGKAKGA
jgi:ElaB/YqjD/DUF883 family membrane-anchored ribosome-binding protein